MTKFFYVKQGAPNFLRRFHTDIGMIVEGMIVEEDNDYYGAIFLNNLYSLYQNQPWRIRKSRQLNSDNVILLPDQKLYRMLFRNIKND